MFKSGIAIALVLALTHGAIAQNLAKKLEAVDDYIIEGNYEYAEKLLVRILGKDDGIHEAHYKLATVWWQSGDSKKALSEAVRAVQLKPENPQYQALLGKLWVENDQPDKALEAFDKALLYDDRLPEVFLYRGDYFLDSKEWTKALKDFKVLEELVSDDPEIFFRLGYAYQGNGNYALGAEYYQKAIRMNPLDHESRFGLSVCLYQMAKYSDALFQLDQLVKFNGEFVDYLYQRALCLVKMYRFNEARSDLLKARKLQKENIDVNFALIGVEERLENFDNALLILDQLLTEFDGMRILYVWKGRILAKKGDLKDAYRNFVFAGQSLDKVDMSFAHDLVVHRCILAYLKNEPEWITDFKKCDPDNIYASCIATCIPSFSSEAEEATQCLPDAVKTLLSDGDDDDALTSKEHFIVAVGLLHQGKIPEAISALKSTIDASDFESSEYHFAQILLLNISRG